MTKSFSFDVDIDLADRDKAIKYLRAIPAGIKRDTGIVKHNTGVYMQDIPYDPQTNIANMDHKDAETHGYLKIDLLNIGIYEDIKYNDDMDRLVNKEPIWELLEEESFTGQLFQIGDYSSLVKYHKPKTVLELAMILAIIRPSKKHLQYKDWTTIKQEVWSKIEDGSYYYKKSHAVSYATAIVVQMNLLEDKMLSEHLMF